MFHISAVSHFQYGRAVKFISSFIIYLVQHFPNWLHLLLPKLHRWPMPILAETRAQIFLPSSQSAGRALGRNFCVRWGHQIVSARQTRKDLLVADNDPLFRRRQMLSHGKTETIMWSVIYRRCVVFGALGQRGLWDGQPAESVKGKCCQTHAAAETPIHERKKNRKFRKDKFDAFNKPKFCLM